MSPHAILRNSARAVFQQADRLFDRCFDSNENPLRHLGAMAFFFFWIVLVSGLYLYTVLDIGLDSVYFSIEHYTREQWLLGGVLRSLHRYGSDAFVVTMFLHLLREWAFDRYAGFRWYSWITGIPLIWLAYVSGIGGYWIVWDRLAQYSAIATTELLDWLPFFADTTARNFLMPESMTDRFFTFLVFLHIGIPLLLLLAAWMHVHRITRVDHFPARRLALGTFAAFLALSLAFPALSDAQADLAQATASTRLDWFILFVHPLTEATSAGFIWALLAALTLLLFCLPLLPHPKQAAVAAVDAPNCNGCRRCYVDCPYQAITMAAHPDKPGHQIAIVDADNCASCGICVGACPSSTPFRSGEALVTGIDMPGQPIGTLRRELEQQIAALVGGTRIVVFGCDQGAAVNQLKGPDTAVFSLVCIGMLPPAFVEYALRAGADGVLVTGCHEDGCQFRSGVRWTIERLAHRREPYLRPQVPRERVREAWAGKGEDARLATALKDFRHHLETLSTSGIGRMTPYSRRIKS